MTTCVRCGAEHAAGSVGRFCTNCGAPRGAVAARAQEPPPVHTAPPPQRFPLYADESASPAPGPAPAPETAAAATHRWRARAPWLAIGLAALVLVAVGVSLLVVGDDQPDSPSAADGTSAPDEPPDPTGTAPTFDGEPEPLVGLASARAPRSDGDSVDISTGEPTTYEPDNLLDGDVETAWRVDGDATGLSLTFTFAEPVTLTGLGLVNGYAKTSVDDAGTRFDLYTGSRRVLEVEWVLNGGEPLPQSLVDGERAPQLLDVGAVEATVVELRLVEVSAPGRGPAARDKTAISEVELSGYAE